MQLNILEEIEKERKYTMGYFKGKAKLVIIQVGNNEASNLYVKSKMTELPKWNIEVELKKFDEQVLEGEILNCIYKCNRDKNVNGIIVQMPLPKHLNEQRIINAIAYEKNVDGFKQSGVDGLVNSYYMPCTPRGVIHVIAEHGGYTNKVITIIGRGKTVGEPLIDYFRNKKCTLLLCNSNTTKEALWNCLATSDIVISAVGKPNLFNCYDLQTGNYDIYTKDKTLVIDVGISRVNGKQVGDFSHEEIEDWMRKVDYTPWVNGMGKMTVAMLAENTIDAWYRQGMDKLLKEADKVE